MSKGAKRSETPRRIRPALTPEARENQMISLSIDLAEQRLLDGTAATPIIVHFLKLASTKAQVEKELLEKQRDLAAAKADSIKSQKKIDELYLEAMNAMRSYSGQEDDSDEEY